MSSKGLVLNLIITFLLLILFLSSCNTVKSFTDLRDGKKYKIINLGKQKWFAENLNFKIDSGSWCYNDSLKYCGKYGRLYEWKSALAACPKGWHLPSEDEWNLLIDNLGDAKIVGGKLKSKAGWNSPNTNATDNFEFSALPGGYRNYLNGKFDNIGNYCNFWTSTMNEGKKHRKKHSSFITLTNNTTVISMSQGFQGTAMSVRCLKD